MLLIVAGLIGGAVYRFGPLEGRPVAPPATPPPIAVSAIAATTATLQDQLVVVGNLVALRRLTISPYSSGHIRRILAADGAEVAAGTALFELDDRTAKAELAAAEAKLGVDRAKLVRDRTLQREGFLAQVTVGTSSADVTQAEIDVRLKQVALDLLTVRAPFAGRLGRMRVAVGQFVAAGDALVDLTDPTSLAMEFRLPERAVGDVRLGATVQFTTDAAPGQSFKGSVAYLAAEVDKANRSLTARAQFGETAAAVLRPGLFGRLTLSIGQPRQGVVVPQAAIVPQLTGASLYRVEDGRAKSIAVELGLRQGADIEIRSGITAGDLVVTAGQFRLRDGDQVAVGPAARP